MAPFFAKEKMKGTPTRILCRRSFQFLFVWVVMYFVIANLFLLYMNSQEAVQKLTEATEDCKKKQGDEEHLFSDKIEVIFIKFKGK